MILLVDLDLPRMRFPSLAVSGALGLALVLAACSANPRPGVQSAQAAAADSSIRESRAALNNALNSGRLELFDSLLSSDTGFHAVSMGERVSRADVVTFARVATSGGRPNILLIPKQAESCIDGGFETGTFTYRPSSDNAADSRYGSYALAWTTGDGPARIRTLVVDAEREPRRIVSQVSCETWRSLQLRSRRSIVAVTPVIDHQGVPNELYDNLASAGWKNGWIDDECVSLGDKYLDYANVPTAIERSSVIHPDPLSILLDVRIRVASTTEIQLSGTPVAASSCSTGYRPSDKTAMTTFFEAKSYSAYAARRFGNFRLGAGPWLQQATVMMRQAKVNNGGGLQSEMGRDTTKKTIFGIGAIAGYTLPLKQGLVADLNARFNRGGSVSLAPLPDYSPKAVPASSYSIGVSLGWGR